MIKARVVSKGDIRTWSNSKSSGQLFSMDLADESGEIRCTAFGEMVDKYYNVIQVILCNHKLCRVFIFAVIGC